MNNNNINFVIYIKEKGVRKTAKGRRKGCFSLFVCVWVSGCALSCRPSRRNFSY